MTSRLPAMTPVPWRQVHERFFTQELAGMGLVFTPDMPVACGGFRRVWPEEGRMSDVD